MRDQCYSKQGFRTWTLIILTFGLLLCCPIIYCQVDTITIGFGENPPAGIMSSSQDLPHENTINQDGYLPNLNAASRFLSQATLGYDHEDIDSVARMGIEDWIDQEMLKPRGFTLLSQIEGYHQIVRDSLMNQKAGAGIRLFDYAWWQYHMKTDDYLRQRVALALSEILVVSRLSGFGNEAYAFGSYCDKLLDLSFGNYRQILDAITYEPSMGLYLTYLNNPKSDTLVNQFPDENYARELMQLFTIGLYELNNDGTRKLDTLNQFIPTYDNEDIAEFAKVFTGLTWGDRTQWGKGALDDTSYRVPLAMWETWHEPGAKNLLNGFVVPNRMPVDGKLDIKDALDNLFAHPNAGPFLSHLLIQRLVTSNPSPEYVGRVADAFNDNGQGTRGDMKAVIKAILLDPEAKACSLGEDDNFGMLREPFVRYMQINRAFNATTLSGDYRNDMRNIFEHSHQKPFSSPSVFNFFQQDYQPIGPIVNNNKVAPEFQIMNSQTIMGFINGTDRWVMDDDPADEYDLFSGEYNSGYEDEVSTLNMTDLKMHTDDNELHILLDELNLVLAQGRVSQGSIDTIVDVLQEYHVEDDDDREKRARLAIYLIMTSPEYQINR